MENMSGVANGVFILPKPTPGSSSKMSILGDKNGRNSAKKYTGKTPPLKPPKKHRSPDDDTEILRCKRRIQFAGRFPVQQRNPKQMAKRNERERNRVQTINSTFEMLQAYLPPGYIQPKPKNKKMSKVEVLHAAINYIRNLQQVLTETDHMTAMHPAHSMQQQQHVLAHPQLMMVTTAPSHMMLSPPPQQHQSLDMPPLQVYQQQQQQTPPVSMDGRYYTNNNNNNNTSLSNNNNPDVHFTTMTSSSVPYTTPITVQPPCSPNSAYSPSGSAHSFDALQQQQTTPPTTGGAVYAAAAEASPPTDAASSEPPLTPEDADIIMEWLHDQKNMES